MTAVSPERAAYEADPWRAPDISWEELSTEDKAKYRVIAQAAVNASPELAGALTLINGLRAMVARKQQAVETAGRDRGLGPVWHEPTFTATEILAVITDAEGASRG